MRTVFKAVIKAGEKHAPWCPGMECLLPDGLEVDVVIVTRHTDGYGWTYQVVTEGESPFLVNEHDLILGESYLEFEGNGDYLHHEYTIDALGIQ